LLYRALIGHFSHGKDENILLITLGLSIIIDNAALFFFTGDTQTIDVAYAGRMIWLGPALVALPKLVSFAAALAICLLLGLFMTRTDMRPFALRQGAAGAGSLASTWRGWRSPTHRHRLPGPPPAC
jgi:branched-subunit amino acid ABC-type transport system permease component